jgi:hypothetical protein
MSDCMTTRGKLGAITLVLLLIAVALQVFGSRDQDPATAGCLRVAIVTGAWWLAYPQLASLPRWLVGITALVAIVAAIKPKLLIVGVPVVLALWMLRPRRPKLNR